MHRGPKLRTRVTMRIYESGSLMLAVSFMLANIPVFYGRSFIFFLMVDFREQTPNNFAIDVSHQLPGRWRIIENHLINTTVDGNQKFRRNSTSWGLVVSWNPIIYSGFIKHPTSVGWEWDFRTASTGLEAAEAFKAELVELLFSLEAHWVQ